MLDVQLTPLLSAARSFALASTVTSYPGEGLAAAVREPWDGSEGALGPASERARGALCAILEGPRGLEDLQSAYLERFDRGKDRAPLYETEYGRMRGMAKGSDLADIAGFYRAFGLEIDGPGTHEMLDHVAVELEFYAVLLLKQHVLDAAEDREGAEIVREARGKFLADHLGRLLQGITGRGDVREDPTYGAVFDWVGALVAQECHALNVEPAPLDFHGDSDSTKHMECGSVHLPVLES
jgi:nitrate reductase assembly molybdenum cofactor insertion protein NarJ